MPTLREVRNRITGVKKTQKITRAMKMVAAAKLHRAQTNVISARPYAATMGKLLTHLAATAGQESDPLLRERPVGSVVLVVVTSDKGMCGGFNSNMIRAAQVRLSTQYPELFKAGKVRLVTVGRKGSDYFRKNNFPVAKAYPGVFARVSFGTAQEIARLLVGMYRSGEADRIEVMFNEFKNIAQQRIVMEQFLPVPAEAMTSGPKKKHGVDYLYEPDGPSILSALIPRYLDFRIWRALLESNASEEGARMTAMENATENASEMISTLQLQYNKARQASITKELLEVVAGAEALAQS